MSDEQLKLTEVERDILVMVASGLTNQQIADVRDGSPDTVRTHIQNMLTHNHVHSKVRLVALAYETGIIVPRWLLLEDLDEVEEISYERSPVHPELRPRRRGLSLRRGKGLRALLPRAWWGARRRRHDVRREPEAGS